LLPPTPGDDDINDLLTFEIPTSCRYFDRSDDEDGLIPVPFSFVLLIPMLVEWMIRLFSLPPKLLLFPVADDDDDEEANGGIRDGITKGLLGAAIVLSIETTPFV